MRRILLCLLLTGIGFSSQAYDLTREDSVELHLIEKEHPSTSQHLYFYISDLQEENSALKKKNAEMSQELEGNDGLNWWWLALSLSLIIALAIYLRINRKKNQQEIAKYQELADKAQQTLEEREKFLAYTNHEIRTPLNAVSGSAELLAGTNLSSNQAKYVKTIKASVDNVLVLVNDVLDLSRIESGNIEFQQMDFLLSDVLNNIAYILQEKVEKKGLQFNIEIDEDIPPVIKGDSRYLNQILINLCNNAVKFTDLGKVTLKASLDKVKDSSYKIRFDIEDTGKGIRKSKLSTIFNQFEQETRHTIKHKGGSGLGLAITKQLVEMQGGVISVDSKYLEGTCFTVIMNFAKGSENKISRTQTDTSVLDNMHILVVDDNELNRVILEDLMQKLNSSVVIESANSGQAAVEILSARDFDCVLMDIQMPGMDGYETTQFIRKNVRRPMNEVPVIAMTAYAMEDVAEKCFQSGMNDFITKPLSSRFLLTKIERIQEKKNGQKGAEIKLEHTNLNNLKRLTKGDTNKMYKYIDLFLQNVPEDLANMKSHMDNHDFQKAIEVLHKIKGNTVYMGNLEVGNIYDKLQKNQEGLEIEKELVTAYDVSQKCVAEIAELRKNYKLLFLGINK